MSGHTPGPWSLRRTIYFLTVVAKGGKRGWRSICQLAYCEGRDLANARLIAAAPTMWAYLERRASSGDIEARQILEAIDVNAIAKAEAPHA